MSDPVDPPEQDEPQELAPESYPWDAEPPLDHSEDGRQRHDAFTEARKCEFLRALVKTGCILDACRHTRISSRTVYRHQESDPRLDDHCAAALRMSGTPVELTAWQRAVEGVEQEYACGGQVHVRRRYDGGLLRLLLQGSNPKKYGPRPGFKRKRLMKHERKQMEREIRAEIRSKRVATNAEVKAALVKRLEIFGARVTAEEDQKKLAAGWIRSPAGDWVPPGYAPIPGWQAPQDQDRGGWGASDGQETPRESM